MKDRTIFKTILAIAFCIILLIGLLLLLKPEWIMFNFD